MAGGRMDTPHPLPLDPLPGHKLRKQSKDWYISVAGHHEFCHFLLKEIKRGNHGTMLP